MIKFNVEDAVIVSREIRQSKAGNDFMMAKIKKTGKHFGNPAECIIEAFVTKNVAEDFPADGSTVNCVLEMTSREYNGKYYYDFTMSGCIPTQSIPKKDLAKENAAALDALDSIPF